jgi:hypothetical protein
MSIFCANFCAYLFSVLHRYELHTYKLHTYELHTYELHTYELHTYVLHTYLDVLFPKQIFRIK